ncbi:MAG: hypothetical protein GF332_01235 [Candidatus Moranbacteria bacterium]|nr:hypothetical protein [Candidatus Moranbacteria bacterium]
MKNLENKIVAIDANILIYASRKTSAYYKVSRELILKGLNNKIQLCIADKTLFEYYAVISNILFKNKPESAIKAYKFYLNQKNLIYLHSSLHTKDIVFELLKTKQAKGKYIHDLVLGAIILENDVDIFITNNQKDFDFLKGVEVLKPI